MNKEKQIEQMARTIDELLVEKPKETTKHEMNVATYLFDRGYRKQEWISVDDRLPEKETKEVICYADVGIGILDVTYFGMDWQRLVRDTTVTHWMPLPEPPKMKGGAE